MKVNKEDFNKLSQLDIIEFRQRLAKIDYDTSPHFQTTIQFTFIIILYILSLTIINIYNVLCGQETLFINNLLLLIIPIGFLLDILSEFSYSNKIKELSQEYFKVEVKKK